MMTRTMVGVGIGLAVGFGAASAQAQQRAGSTSNANAPLAQRADQPLLAGNFKPTLSFEAGAGVLGYIGGTAGLGPAWDIRAIFGVSERVAVEGNYLGSFNERSGRPGSLVYTGIDADVRYNLLLPDQAWVQPFVTGGFGYAAFIGRQGQAAALTFPISIGAERLLFRQIKIGARLNVRPAVFDNLGGPGEQNPPGGDTWSLVANLGGSF